MDFYIPLRLYVLAYVLADENKRKIKAYRTRLAARIAYISYSREESQKDFLGMLSEQQETMSIDYDSSLKELELAVMDYDDFIHTKPLLRVEVNYTQEAALLYKFISCNVDDAVKRLLFVQETVHPLYLLALVHMKLLNPQQFTAVNYMNVLVNSTYRMRAEATVKELDSIIEKVSKELLGLKNPPKVDIPKFIVMEN